jgi:hypothetical protein
MRMRMKLIVIAAIYNAHFEKHNEIGDIVGEK